MDLPIPDVAPNLARPTLQDEVYPTVREWIVTGELRPGEVLKDKELAEKFGVSRTPVREALQRLRNEGFVQTESNRWTRVARIDDTNVAEIYEIVKALEAAAIASAGPRLGDADFRAMTEANDRLSVALEDDDPNEASQADAAFHDVFVRKSGNSQLIRILDDLRTKLRRAEIAYFQRPVAATMSVKEHAAVVSALRRHDYAAAATALQNNWDESLARLRRGRE